jgi:hypothetical protein
MRFGAHSELGMTKSLKPRTRLGFSACKAVEVLPVGVSPPKLGGVAATQIEFREASLAGADGVVPIAETFQECICDTFRFWNHPVRAFGASTPPNLGGDTPTCNTFIALHAPDQLP